VAFQSLQFADSAALQQLTRFDEWRIEAALMAKRQLHTGIFSGLVHGARFAPGGRHRLFAVNRFCASVDAINDLLAMLFRPGANADDIELVVGQHFFVILMDVLDTVSLGQLLRRFENRVGHRHNLHFVRRLFISKRVLASASTTTNDAHLQLCHKSAPLIQLFKRL
jgi:hypothetical protein